MRNQNKYIFIVSFLIIEELFFTGFSLHPQNRPTIVHNFFLCIFRFARVTSDVEDGMEPHFLVRRRLNFTLVPIFGERGGVWCMWEQFNSDYFHLVNFYLPVILQPQW